MAHIKADNLVVDFPVYDSRSFKNLALGAAVGGGLAKDRKDRTVVRAINGLTFEIREGDRVGLLGPNGSGKSTLLRVMAGGYEPVSGSLDMLGSVGSMLSITLGMDVDATGYENIFMLGLMMGIDKKNIIKLTPEIADFTELGDFLRMPMRTYSSGMSMRLAFAVATAVKRDIILMDEWLSVGDASFLKKAEERLNEVLRGAKILVLASHNKDFLHKECNRIFHIEHGRLMNVEVL